MREDHELIVIGAGSGGVAASRRAAAAMNAAPANIYASDFRPMKTAFAGSTARTYMKLVVDGLSERVPRVHTIGADAPEIVQSLAVALTCGAAKRDFDRTLAVHPTAAEEFVLTREPVRRHGAATATISRT